MVGWLRGFNVRFSNLSAMQDWNCMKAHIDIIYISSAVGNYCKNTLIIEKNDVGL